MKYIPEQILSDFSEQTLRLDECIFLPLAFEAETASDALGRFLEDFPETPDDAIFTQWETISRFADGDEFPTEQDLIDAILDAYDTGFLIQVARPVMKTLRDGVKVFSWGYYHTEWIYGATLPEALERAIAWAKQRDLEDCAEAEGGAA